MNPCYKCEDREIGCHSKCELYLNWQAEEKQRKEEIDKVRNPMKDYENYKKGVIDMMRRRYGRR